MHVSLLVKVNGERTVLWGCLGHCQLDLLKKHKWDEDKAPTPTPAFGTCEPSSTMKSLFQMSSALEPPRSGVATDTCVIPVTVELGGGAS